MKKYSEYKYLFSMGQERWITAENLYDEINVTALESIFQYRFSPKFTFPGETHDLYEFFYVIQGNMKVVTGKGTFYLSPGEFIIVPPNLFHSMMPNKCYSYSVAITFACEGLNDELATLKKGNLTQEERSFLNTIIKNYIDNMDKKDYGIIRPAKNEYAYHQLIKNQMESLLIMVTRLFQERKILQNEHVSLSNELLADKIKGYIEEHFKEKLLLEDIAKEFGYSVGHISRAFKKKYNSSIINHILLRRIESSLVLIDKGNMNLQSISDELGFDSVQYFSKVFKRFTNVTPGEYKRIVNTSHILNSNYILTDILTNPQE